MLPAVLNIIGNIYNAYLQLSANQRQAVAGFLQQFYAYSVHVLAVVLLAIAVLAGHHYYSKYDPHYCKFIVIVMACFEKLFVSKISSLIL